MRCRPPPPLQVLLAEKLSHIDNIVLPFICKQGNKDRLLRDKSPFSPPSPLFPRVQRGRCIRTIKTMCSRRRNDKTRLFQLAFCACSPASARRPLLPRPPPPPDQGTLYAIRALPSYNQYTQSTGPNRLEVRYVCPPHPPPQFSFILKHIFWISFGTACALTTFYILSCLGQSHKRHATFFLTRSNTQQPNTKKGSKGSSPRHQEQQLGLHRGRHAQALR